MATSGFGPASATANDNATGSLSMRTTETSSPLSFWRTIIDRRLCKSMATYCRSTGPPLRTERIGLVATNLLPLEPFPEGEDPPTERRAATTTSLLRHD